MSKPSEKLITPKPEAHPPAQGVRGIFGVVEKLQVGHSAYKKLGKK